MNKKVTNRFISISIFMNNSSMLSLCSGCPKTRLAAGKVYMLGDLNLSLDK